MVELPSVSMLAQENATNIASLEGMTITQLDEELSEQKGKRKLYRTPSEGGKSDHSELSRQVRGTKTIDCARPGWPRAD